MFIIAIVLFGNTIETQSKKDMSGDFILINNAQISLRTKPILNREYLICLAWHLNVYISFPEKIIELIPNQDIKDKSLNLYPQDFFNNNILNTGILSNYVFKSEYLDFPVVGLSDKQYQIVMRWMRDRYNENQCIINENINKESFQIDGASFSTESFLVEQYSNIKPIENVENWTTSALKPQFRSPVDNELLYISKEVNMSHKLLKYDFDSSDFLWRWNEKYINVKENGIVELKHFDPIELKSGSESWSKLFNKFDFQTIPLSNQISQKTDLFLFSDNSEYVEKNAFGQMDFSIVGYSKEGELLKAELLFSEKDSNLNNEKIFLIVHD